MRSAHSEVVDSIEGTDGALSIPSHGVDVQFPLIGMAFMETSFFCRFIVSLFQ